MKRSRHAKIAILLLVFLLPVLSTRAQVLVQDSLTLVTFYHATGGTGWTNNENWLQPGKNVSTWYGVILRDGRVWDLILPDNNLTGSIPPETGELYGLRGLVLPGNHLSGTIPSTLNKINRLHVLELTGNEFTGDIPSYLFHVPPPDDIGSYKRNVHLDGNHFTGISAWSEPFANTDWISVADNGLDFADIESIMAEMIRFFIYSPQKPVYAPIGITVREGVVLTLKTGVAGSANHYQWLKDGSVIPDAAQANYTLKPLLLDAGIYTARITSDVVTALTLERNPVTLKVKEDTVYVSCEGKPVTLDVAVPDAGAAYRWSNGQATASITVSATGKYGIEIETADYILKDTLQVVIHPELSLGPDIDACQASVPLSSNVMGAATYEWQTPTGIINGQSAITATINGRYILTVSSDECVQMDMIEVVLNHFTEGDYTIMAGIAAVEANSTVLSDVSLYFTNTTETGEGFTWSFGDGSNSSEGSPEHSFKKAGQYTITLSGLDNRNCPVTVEKNINVEDLVVTNAISPNGDGKNDKLYVEPFLYNASLKIINRWGQSVYEEDSYRDDFAGRNLESGVYYYELYFKEIDKKYKGYFHIMK